MHPSLHPPSFCPHCAVLLAAYDAASYVKALNILRRPSTVLSTYRSNPTAASRTSSLSLNPWSEEKHRDLIEQRRADVMRTVSNVNSVTAASEVNGHFLSRGSMGWVSFHSND